MSMGFCHNEWIDQLSSALSALVESVEHPPFTPQKASTPALRSIEEARQDDLQRYKKLGALARTSPYASKFFSKTNFPVRDTPEWRTVTDVIVNHPCFTESWFDRGTSKWDSPPFALLITSLAKLSVRTSGRHAATRLHRFLVLGRCTLLPAYEITLLHGLGVTRQIDLGGKAYLAPYEEVRTQFGLEEDPEHWLTHSGWHPHSLSDDQSTTAFVRRFSWGTNFQLGIDSHESQYLRYWHPADHKVSSLSAMFHEREMLTKILSVVMETKLVSHTVIIHLPTWMRSLDPNFGFDRTNSGARLSDVWPQDRPATTSHVETYISVAKGWLANYSKTNPFKLDLAIDRVFASYRSVSGDFGFADPIVDVSIALEAMYGPFKANTIAKSLSKRAGWVLAGTKGSRRKIAKVVKSFYENSRSNVIHAVSQLAYHEKELSDELEAGRNVARESLLAMLEGDLLADEVSEWDDRLSRGNRKHPYKLSMNSRN